MSQHTTLTPAVLLFVSTLQVAPTPSWSHSFLAGRLQTDHFMMILGSSKKNNSTDFLPHFPFFPLFSKGVTGKPPGWFFGKATSNWLDLASHRTKPMFFCDQNNQQLAEASVQPRTTYSLPTKALVNRWWWWFLSFSQSWWDTADASEIRSPNHLRCYTKQKTHILGYGIPNLNWCCATVRFTGFLSKKLSTVSLGE